MEPVETVAAVKAITPRAFGSRFEAATTNEAVRYRKSCTIDDAEIAYTCAGSSTP